MIVEFFNLDKTGIQPVAAFLYLCNKYFDKKVLLWCENERQLSHLDQALWSYEPESFLPHGTAGEEGAAGEPVLLSTELNNLNQAKVLILAHNPASSWLPPMGFERVVELIPLIPGPQLEACRYRYRMLSKKAILEHTTSIAYSNQA